jgi:hypothetical protein
LSEQPPKLEEPTPVADLPAAPATPDAPAPDPAADPPGVTAEPARLAPPTGAGKDIHPARRFAWALIPLIALLELATHFVQVNRVVSDDEWLAARDAVRTLVKPTDLVVMAPYWTDPIGRELFKDEILSLAREARPDASRFPRAIEVSIRGQHDPELRDWSRTSTQNVGPVTLTVFDNPSYRPILDDLVDHVAPGRMNVLVPSRQGMTECAFGRGKVETGGLGFGPAIPAGRFQCPGGGMVAATVMQPGDYRPHQCVFAPSLGGGKTMRIAFQDVTFGDVLHGHAGIEWDATAHADDPPVTLVWKKGDSTLGRIVAGNTDGWKSFELSTGDVKGQKGELVAEVSSPSGRGRMYCFEADTR